LDEHNTEIQRPTAWIYGWLRHRVRRILEPVPPPKLPVRQDRNHIMLSPSVTSRK
jgi:hypothetical protein